MIFASEYLHEERPGMQVAADPRREEAPLEMDVGINLWWGGGLENWLEELEIATAEDLEVCSSGLK